MRVARQIQTGKRVVSVAESEGESLILVGQKSPVENFTSSLSSKDIWANPSYTGPAIGLGGGEETTPAAIHVAAVESHIEGYNPYSPFVFGAGPIVTRKFRKWKQAARVSEKYSFDLLCHELMFQVGSKWSSSAFI
ncbi:hypothetical protein COLO4_19143 [Corchorus olitorius]|uniref:Uncharacterized protein n=1 Tax=Corchorus olitorius TaxID=93759 RepID=A0A1R3J6M9_9ROSI|nr:hypothetical protein COLO4_19143 [Corchorus olitorius]